MFLAHLRVLNMPWILPSKSSVCRNGCWQVKLHFCARKFLTFYIWIMHVFRMVILLQLLLFSTQSHSNISITMLQKRHIRWTVGLLAYQLIFFNHCATGRRKILLLAEQNAKYVRFMQKFNNLSHKSVRVSLRLFDSNGSSPLLQESPRSNAL